MAKAWAGDGRYELPAKKVEPYRLWFEFLKAALRDPETKVNKKFYKDWGDFEGQTFDEWWSTGIWRNLFAVDLGNGVEVLESGVGAPRSDDLLTVTIPLNQDPNRSLADIQAILSDYQAKQVGSGKRKKGKFSLTEGSEQGFEKRMNAARCMLRLYGYWLDHSALSKKHQVEEACLAYWKWSTDWANQIRTNKWNRPLPYYQQAFALYSEYLFRKRRLLSPAEISKTFKPFEEEKNKPKYTQKEIGTVTALDEGVNAEDARRMVVRYIRKARNVAANVGRGEFPGKY